MKQMLFVIVLICLAATMLAVEPALQANPLNPLRTETPVPPEDVVVSVVGSNVSLSWDPVTADINGSPLVPDGYSVYYSPDPNVAPGAFTHLADVTGTSYIHVGAASAFSKDFYCVTAYKDQIIIPPNFVLVPGGAMSVSIGGGNYITMTVSTFLIGQYEVTEAQYMAVMGGNPSWYPVEGGPVDAISWYRAIRYCNYRSMQDGITPCYHYVVGSTDYGTDIGNWPSGWSSSEYNHVNVHCDWNATGYRLPTEMEWMFAAKGGNLSHNYDYSGSNNIGAVAWYNSNSGGTKHAVGNLNANELLTFDMSGNVQEWCWDIYAAYPATSQYDYKGPTTGNYRTFRGGCWSQAGGSCNVNYRLYTSANIYNGDFGFRGARSLP